MRYPKFCNQRFTPMECLPKRTRARGRGNREGGARAAVAIILSWRRIERTARHPNGFARRGYIDIAATRGRLPDPPLAVAGGHSDDLVEARRVNHPRPDVTCSSQNDDAVVDGALDRPLQCSGLERAAKTDRRAPAWPRAARSRSPASPPSCSRLRSWPRSRANSCASSTSRSWWASSASFRCRWK